ncbi:hypothetical protein JS756_09695 [Streptomyces actuosus]|uniref:Extensin n=1 Tax=Streptomyces actuosus TaxID=1885 RepID=A0ABS2VMQ3_STRAS|nr:hypothetical protein [Streptomyces actuosus]MBN0044380.1 hypothetical protein [Streptomyces actuosus]
MADEQYRWLDRDTAERLLRGEPLDAVDADARDEAERLAEALGALSATPAPTSTELPGEAAALAAFRAARAGSAEQHAGAPRTGGHRSGASRADAGLIRLGGTGHPSGRVRRGRHVRLGLAAALAVCTVGGVAVAAGTGVLPSPFGGPAGPGPAVSVSAADTPGRGSSAPSRGATTTPDGGATGSAGPDTARGAAGGATPAPSGSAVPGGTGAAPPGATAACQDLSSGRDLDDARRRFLESAAGDARRVWTYCKDVLNKAGKALGTDRRPDGTGSTGSGTRSGGRGHGTGGAGKSDDDDRDGSDRRRHGHGHGGISGASGGGSGRDSGGGHGSGGGTSSGADGGRGSGHAGGGHSGGYSE